MAAPIEAATFSTAGGATVLHDLWKSRSRGVIGWISAWLLAVTTACLDSTGGLDRKPGYTISYPTYVAIQAGTSFSLPGGLTAVPYGVTSPDGVAQVDVQRGVLVGLREGFAEWNPGIDGYAPMRIAVLNRRRQGPMLVGHHGVPTLAPENTLAGIQLACGLGIPGIEVDVRFTADSVAVLMHDRDVKRTSNGAGYVDQLSLNQLEQLDVGSWFDPKFAGERVPTLTALLTASVACGLDHIQLDVKTFTPLSVDTGLVRIGRTVNDMGLLERVFLSSTSLNTLKRGTVLVSGLHTLLYGGILTPSYTDAVISGQIEAVGIRFDDYPSSSAQLARLDSAGVMIGVWAPPGVLDLNALTPAPQFVTSDWGWRFVN